MAEGPSRASQKGDYAAVIDQDKVTDEVRDIALKYDPLSQSGREGFHVTDEGELHIDQANVIEEHKIVANKVPNDAIRIVRLPAERGELVHQYGENGFRLYELPAPVEDRVVGLLGPNGVGKSTALRILGKLLAPNLGDIDEEPGWDAIVREFRGTAAQNYLAKLRDGTTSTAYKPQRVDRIPETYGGTLRELVEERDGRDVADAAIERLELKTVADRSLHELSGGELQRAAIAATLVADVDTYLIDEPSSYLDVRQRLTVARVLESLATDERQVVLVDHDLITLDIATDNIHLFYGDPGAFGVVSRPLTARHGINQFLEGELRAENVRIREEAIDLSRTAQRGQMGQPVLDFPPVSKSFASFSLTVEAGGIHEGEVLAVLGRNALGKTTFAKLLAGALEPNEGELDTEVRISYKPQLLEPAFEGTVQQLFARTIEIDEQAFRTEVHQPLKLDPIWGEDVATLSGGERQRVGIALALARQADVYLLDEPSAYLDVEQRMTLASTLRRFVDRRGTPCLLIDHDLMLLDHLADRAMVFEGEPGLEGVGRSPQPWREGLDRFLETVGITFRRDPDTGRPRANDAGSQKDREQRDRGEYYAT